jgi:hypothetical protein
MSVAHLRPNSIMWKNELKIKSVKKQELDETSGG